jgi:hypothetical protein
MIHPIFYLSIYTLTSTFTPLTLSTHTGTNLINGILLQQDLKTKRLKRHTLAHKMLTHSLHPMQSQRMQHRTRALHHTQHENSEHKPEPEGDDDHDDLHGARHAEGVGERHVPEHDRELLVGEREGPETEV